MLPKLHLACSDNELRVAMNHIQIDSNRVVATDGMILVWISTEKLFGEEITSQLTNDPIYIHKKDWGKFTKPYRSISYNGGVFSIQRKDFSIDTVEPSRMEDRFPVYEDIIPTYNVSQVDSLIGLDPRLAVRALEAMSYPNEKNTGLNLCITGKNRSYLAWVVSNPYNYSSLHELDAKAIIFPCQTIDGSELF